MYRAQTAVGAAADVEAANSTQNEEAEESVAAEATVGIRNSQEKRPKSSGNLFEDVRLP